MRKIRFSSIIEIADRHGSPSGYYARRSQLRRMEGVCRGCRVPGNECDPESDRCHGSRYIAIEYGSDCVIRSDKVLARLTPERALSDGYGMPAYGGGLSSVTPEYITRDEDGEAIYMAHADACAVEADCRR